MSDLDLDAPVRDRLLLVTVPGAVDHLAAEVERAAATGSFAAPVVRRLSDGLLLDHTGPLRPLAAVRPFSGCAVWLADRMPADPADLDVTTLTAASRTAGVLGALASAGPVGFRVAPDLGESRWPLRDALESDLDWPNTPADWRVNWRSHGGALVADVGPLFQTARFGGSPDARLDHAGHLLGPGPAPQGRAGDLVLDPFCGAGTNLVVAAEAVPDLDRVGLDLDPRALAAAGQPHRHPLGPRRPLARSDAARLPLPDGAVDRMVANLPFGKRISTHVGNQEPTPRSSAAWPGAVDEGQGGAADQDSDSSSTPSSAPPGSGRQETVLETAAAPLGVRRDARGRPGAGARGRTTASAASVRK